MEEKEEDDIVEIWIEEEDKEEECNDVEVKEEVSNEVVNNEIEGNKLEVNEKLNKKDEDNGLVYIIVLDIELLTNGIVVILTSDKRE